PAPPSTPSKTPPPRRRAGAASTASSAATSTSRRSAPSTACCTVTTATGSKAAPPWWNTGTAASNCSTGATCNRPSSATASPTTKPPPSCCACRPWRARADSLPAWNPSSGGVDTGQSRPFHRPQANPADAHVVEALRHHRVRVEQVATVEDHRLGEPGADQGEVRRPEGLPLGADGQGIGAIEGGVLAVHQGQPRAVAVELAARVQGGGVVGPHPGAGVPQGFHQRPARGLPHVI